jgi:hypothetical protein
MLTDARIALYCKMLASSRSVEARDSALDAIVLHLSDTGELRTGLTRAEQDHAARAFAERRIREDEEEKTGSTERDSKRRFIERVIVAIERALSIDPGANRDAGR